MSEPQAKRPTGRPTLYTPELVEEVCDRLSKGEPLTVICQDQHMPCDDTVRNWAASSDELSRAIARARATGFDAIAWRSRQTIRGKMQDEGGESTGDVQRDKAIVDHDLKLLAKWDPKRYGDRVAHVGGGNDDAPIRYKFEGLSDEELERRIAAKEAALTDGDPSDDDAG
jgi:hypothetical protein